MMKSDAAIVLLYAAFVIMLCVCVDAANDYGQYNGTCALVNVCCDTAFQGNITSVTNDTITLDGNTTINIFSVSWVKGSGVRCQ